MLLRFENGAPLLLEQPLARARADASPRRWTATWNDLAIHPLFVRFVAEATAYLAGARAEAGHGHGGFGIRIATSAAAAAARCSIPRASAR